MGLPLLALLTNAKDYIKAGTEIFNQIKEQVSDGKTTLNANEQEVFDELEAELQESRAAHANLKDALSGN